MKVSGDLNSGKNLKGIENKTDAKAADKNVSGAKQQGAFPDPASVRVNVSDRAHDISKIKQMATPRNDVDMEKVDRLQKLIDSGKYKVDSEAVADRLVDDHMMFPD